MVGSLLYAAITTRPDIAQEVGAVSNFNSYPSEAHLTVVKRILCYIKGMINLKLRYERSADDNLTEFMQIGSETWTTDILLQGIYLSCP